MITRLKVRNFKSLRNIDLSLGPLNVLVGPNLGGKSNILDVFRFIYDLWFPQPGTYGPGNALAGRGGIDEVAWKGTEAKLISIAAEIGDPSQPGAKFLYDIELVGGAGGFVNIQKEDLRLSRDGNEVPLISLDGGRWLRNPGGPNLVSVSPGQALMENAPPNWQGYRAKELVAGWRRYQLIPALMKEPSKMTEGNALDQPYGKNISAWLMWLQTRQPETFHRIAEVVRDIFPEVHSLFTSPTQQGTVYLASRETSLLRPSPVFQMSDGELVLIALLSLIYASPSLSATLLSIEEIENHLHPRLFETLVALIRQVRQEVADSGVEPAQVILTTQSPFVLDQMTIEEVIWVEKKDGETKVVRPSDKAHLKSLVENKELGLGDLMFAGTLGD